MSVEAVIAPSDQQYDFRVIFYAMGNAVARVELTFSTFMGLAGDSVISLTRRRGHVTCTPLTLKDPPSSGQGPDDLVFTDADGNHLRRAKTSVGTTS